MRPNQQTLGQIRAYVLAGVIGLIFLAYVLWR